MMMKNKPILWVELDRKPSKYLINSINLHNERFPEIEKYLILNRRYEYIVKNLKVRTIFIEDLKSYKDISAFQAENKNSNGLQKTYWTNTTARFFAINAFMKDLNINNLIHLESDCILLSLNAIEKFFNSSDWGLKYAKQHINYGCASILLVSEQSELQSFLEFTSRNWHRDNFTDMNALGEFVNQSNLSNFLYSGSPFDEINKDIFDGVTIGRYFIGGDARNSRWPFSTRGIVGTLNEEFNPSNFTLSVRNDLVYLANENIELELQNIHIHSKRIPKNWSKLMKIIQKDGIRPRSDFWRFGHFDSIVFKERFVSFLQRRLLRNKSADPRFR
jgi:hypothetical protein